MNIMNSSLRTSFALSILLLASCSAETPSHLSEKYPILRDGPHGMEFAFIPAGVFQMGSPKEEVERNQHNGDEQLHWVEITKDYWMQKTEVTRGQWYAVMGSYPDDKEECLRYVTQRDDHPVTCVSWDMVQNFVGTLNTEVDDGFEYRIPTEAEWEFAARGFTEGAYGVAGPTGSFAWYDKVVSTRTNPVGKLKTNIFGLHDMHGNVWEWVSDWYGPYEYEHAQTYQERVIDPRGARIGSARVLRGGGRSSSARSCRSAYRFGNFPGSRTSIYGFRLVRTKR